MICTNFIDLDVHAHFDVASENDADSADDYENDKHYVPGGDNYIKIIIHHNHHSYLVYYYKYYQADHCAMKELIDR